MAVTIPYHHLSLYIPMSIISFLDFFNFLSPILVLGSSSRHAHSFTIDNFRTCTYTFEISTSPHSSKVSTEITWKSLIEKIIIIREEIVLEKAIIFSKELRLPREELFKYILSTHEIEIIKVKTPTKPRVIIPLPLLRVRKHLIGLGDIFELFLCFLFVPNIFVRVPFHSKFSIGLFYCFLVSIFFNS